MLRLPLRKRRRRRVASDPALPVAEDDHSIIRAFRTLEDAVEVGPRQGALAFQPARERESAVAFVERDILR